jgi:hypothetical protein
MPQILSLSSAQIERSPSRETGSLSSSLSGYASSVSLLALNNPPLATSSSAPNPAPVSSLLTFAPPTAGSATLSSSGVPDLGPPAGVRVRNGVKDILYNIGGVSTIIYLIATAQVLLSFLRYLFSLLLSPFISESGLST